MYRQRALVTLTLLVATTACSVDTAPRPEASAPSRITPPTVTNELRALRLPFESFALSRADIYLIEAGEDVLTRRCMREQGYDWTVLTLPSGSDPTPTNRRRYGVIEPQVADRFGYHMLPDDAWAVRREREKRSRMAALSAKERVAAYGSDPESAGGCWAKAGAQLGKGVPEYDEGTLNGHKGDNFERAQRMPEVVRVIAAWRACMKRAGYTYRDPFEALGDPRWGESEHPGELELRTARADVRCKRENDVVAVWKRVEARTQREVIRKHPEDFRKLKAAKDAWLTAARNLL